MKYIKDLNCSSIELIDLPNDLKLIELLERSLDKDISVIDIVNKIEKEVLIRGDEAIRELTNKLDGVYLENFKVNDTEFDSIEKLIDDDIKNAILLAKNNIQIFHERQIPKNLKPKETSKGVYCWRQFRAIEKVGLYIPGGTASLFSTLLMLAIPAKIAGCKEIKICTPANKKGEISPEILYTAKILGIRDIYKIGGAQAIFAMGYGTKQIKKVDKIFGPGNSFVTEAKIKISKFCAIDMPAGPSEVLVIADEKSNTKYVASDLLSQCEHGKDSQCVLICNNEDKLKKIIIECQKQLLQLSRKDFAINSMKNSFAILVNDIDKAIEISNIYAPEHLILQIKSWEKYTAYIINAGSVFCGKYSPESAGDYCSGTNHTLPTSGFAKSYSGVGLESFGKWITFQKITKKGLKNIGKSIEIMSSSEGLNGHKNAVSIRY